MLPSAWSCSTSFNFPPVLSVDEALVEKPLAEESLTEDAPLPVSSDNEGKSEIPLSFNISLKVPVCWNCEAAESREAIARKVFSSCN